MQTQRVGKYGTPYTSPSIKDLLRQRKLLKNKLQRANVHVRTCGRVIEALKQKYPLHETIERLQRDVEQLQRLAEEQAAYASELSENLAITQARLRSMVQTPTAGSAPVESGT